MKQFALYLLSGRQGHGGRSLLFRRIEEPGLQIRRRIFLGDSGEIAAGRVTGRAFPFSVEISLAGFDISCQKLLGRITAHRACVVCAAGNFDARMEKRSDIRNLGRAEIGKRRHSLIGASLPDHSIDQIALYIMAHKSGFEQTRSRAPDRSTAMAYRARLLKLGASPPHVWFCHGIFGHVCGRRQGEKKSETEAKDGCRETADWDVRKS